MVQPQPLLSAITPLNIDMAHGGVRLALAMQAGFAEISHKCNVYALPNTGTYIGLLFVNDWCITIYYFETCGPDECVTMWPPQEYMERINGPSLSDPQFFEKCVKIMSRNKA